MFSSCAWECSDVANRTHSLPYAARSSEKSELTDQVLRVFSQAAARSRRPPLANDEECRIGLLPTQARITAAAREPERAPQGRAREQANPLPRESPWRGL